MHSDPEIVSGTPVFVGTRVPAQALLDYLEGGETIEEFLDDFPSVSREQVIAFLEEAGRALLARAVPVWRASQAETDQLLPPAGSDRLRRDLRALT